MRDLKGARDAGFGNTVRGFAGDVPAVKLDFAFVVVESGDQIVYGGFPGTVGSCDAEYLAFVGSRRKFASYRDRLIAAGIAAELIGDVRSPAGLHIDAVTPEEIALSIMAEIVRTRRSTSRAEAAHG